MAEPGGPGPDRGGFAARFEARAGRTFLRRLMLLSATFGALSALALAPFYLWPLGPLGLAGLFGMFSIAKTVRRAFWLGWAGGAGYFALALFWIVEPFFVDLARHGWMAPFALIFLSGGLALFWGAAFALARWLGGRRALVWIATLTGAEMLRSYVLTGFPWALIGYVWSSGPVAQHVAFIGPHGLSMLALIAGVSLWQLAAHRLMALPTIAGGIVLIGLGMILNAPTPAPDDAPVIRMVQPNAPQHQKWDPDHVLTFFDRQLGFTAAPPQGARAPDLVVWPETAIPWLLENADQPLRMIAAEAGEAPVVLGLRQIRDRKLFNTLIVIDGNGTITAQYDKHHLVPFGEYIPLGNLADKIGIHGLAAREGYGYSPGPGARLIELPGIGPALPLICYEAIFPQDVNAAPARPRLLLQLTNDAWFGQFSGPFQHLQQARMRAIEQGLPMLRVANTGVSALIGPKGEMLGRIPLGTAGVLDVSLPDALPATLYARSGDWPMLVVLLIALIPSVLRRIRHH
jgi:apolipoprotein N-acyltransferase